MKAKIMMIIDGDVYEYGTYPFETCEDKQRVNELAIQVREERRCQVYVEKVG